MDPIRGVLGRVRVPDRVPGMERVALVRADRSLAQADRSLAQAGRGPARAMVVSVQGARGVRDRVIRDSALVRVIPLGEPHHRGVDGCSWWHALRFYDPAAIRSLLADSHNRCAYPGCELPLADPRWKQMNAQIAHIHGESLGSARYDPKMSETQRMDVSNLLLLCPNHHKLIDALMPDEHPAEMLRDMKEAHECAGDRGTSAWASDPELDRLAHLLMESSGAIMIDWLSDDDAVEIEIVEIDDTDST